MPNEPWVALVYALLGAVIEPALTGTFPWSLEIAVPIFSFILMFLNTALVFTQESRRQPSRCAEFSLAANALLLIAASWLLALARAAYPLGTDLCLFGGLLAVAAALVDCLAKWLDRPARQAQPVQPVIVPAAVAAAAAAASTPAVRTTAAPPPAARVVLQGKQGGGGSP